MPLRSPFTTSFGTDSEKDVFVFFFNQNGIKAYSESVTNEDPFYGPEDNTRAFHVIKEYLVDMIKDLPTAGQFNERSSFVKGNDMAKAAIEMLLCDYHSKLSKNLYTNLLVTNHGDMQMLEHHWALIKSRLLS